MRTAGPGPGRRGVAISLGAVVFAEHQYRHPEEPLIAADAAMYEAKRAGGGRFRVAPAGAAAER